MIGMLYRCVLGCAMAKWWTRMRLKPRTVLFGHTGIADTTLLELAMQGAGTATIHAVHGISAGVNFSGRSTLAVFRCGHDADWHTTLGGYGSCRAPTALRPACLQGDAGTLLLTSLAHPMNPRFQTEGIKDELNVLDVVASVVADAGLHSKPMIWKPHPIVLKLGKDEAACLQRHAGELGFQRAPDQIDYPDAARRFRSIHSTASTVIIELLAAGSIPIMLDWQSIDPDSALAQYPLRAYDKQSLRKALDAVSSDRLRTELFERAWTSVRPSPAFSLRDIDGS